MTGLGFFVVKKQSIVVIKTGSLFLNHKVPKLKTTTTVSVMISLASDPTVEKIFNVQKELKSLRIGI